MAHANDDIKLAPSDVDPASRRASRISSRHDSKHHKEAPKVAETWGEMFREWPKQSFFIVVNEASERFSYYGMRTVLTLYLLNILKFSDNDSSIFFNTFSSLCYLSPLLGAIIADGFIGKFLTIFFVSILYAIGQIILAFVSTRSSGSSLHPWIDFLGLLIIALGTGGIKPCVSPFGGDQFDPHQVRMISIFFSVFYFSINAGSMISTFVTPIFRATPCLDQDTCYPLAFGIPAALMVVATVAFMAGSFWYKKKPPKFNVFKAVAVVVKKAIGNKISTGEKRDHWLDHALTTHTCEYNPKCIQRKRRRNDPSACSEAKFVDDVKSLFRVLIMYIPLPIFWSLYDQQASTWTIQAVSMDSRLWGTTLMLPDQMQVLNAVLILAFIPIFQAIIYPFFNMFFTLTPLRRMVGGGALAGLSFLIAAFIQVLVNKTAPILPSVGNSYVSVVNALPDCTLNVTVVGQNLTMMSIPPQRALQNTHGNITTFELEKKGEFHFQFASSGNCPSFVTGNNNVYPFTIPDAKISYIYVNNVGMLITSIKPDKSKEGTGEFATAIIAGLNDTDYDKNFAFCRVNEKNVTATKCDPKTKINYFFFKVNYTNADGDQSDLMDKVPYTVGDTKRQAAVFKVKSVRPGDWRLFYMDGADEGFTWTGIQYKRYQQGGVYLVSLAGAKNNPTWMEFNVTPDNGVSILWQVPQIVVITAAEILFSITGLEFSYTQAAPSMKAVIGAAFLLTTGIGDMLIVLINLIHFTDNYAVLFLVYAIVMFVVITIFAFMSIFYYTYADYTEIEDDDDEDCESSSNHEDDSSTRSTKSILGHNKFKNIDLDGDAWQTKL